MKRLFSILILAVMVLSLLSPLISTGVLADRPPEEQTIYEALNYGETRISPTAKIKKIKELPGVSTEYSMEVSSIPLTMPDLKTLIVCEWRQGSDLDGKTFYETGNNLLFARVSGTRVSVEYNSKLAVWDPVVSLGGKALEVKSGPTLVKDLFNPNYDYNTIQWVYNGNKVIRYLRQIEGSIQEYYILDKDPKANLEISNGYKQEVGFSWAGDVYAYDKDSRPLIINGDKTLKLILKEEFAREDIKYPVTIDPTTTVVTSAYDCSMSNSNAIYSDTRMATVGTVSRTGTLGWVGQSKVGDMSYIIDRLGFYFPTGDLPDTSIITSSYISLYGYNDVSAPDFNIVVQSGMPTHPSEPPVVGDYNQAWYSGTGGSYSTSGGWSTTGYNLIPLDAVGMGWINKTGMTKFVLRSDRDITGVPPGGTELVGAYMYEKGAGYQPTLTVYYTVPPSPPVIDTTGSSSITSTGASLAATLTSDGGATCSVFFKYGTALSYTQQTAYQSGKTTGATFIALTDALLPGTLYHFTGVAQSIGGVSTDDDMTFLSLPEAPTNFVVTAGNVKNDLTWAKGTGSGNTYIYRRTDHVPVSRTEVGNVLVYSGVAALYTDTPLTNGVKYYYAAWAEKTAGGLQQFSATKVSGDGTPYVAGVAVTETLDATSVGATSAVFNGHLTSLMGYGSANCYFQYYWGAGAWVDHDTIADLDVLTAPGTFSSPVVAALPAATLIHVRSVANNGDGGGPGHGVDNSFTTGVASPPTVTSNAASGVTRTTANVAGTVTDIGGASLITVWFEYGTSESYGYTTIPITATFTSGQSLTDILGLNPYPALKTSTLYHFAAFAQNSAGESRSADRTFTTLAPAAPTVITLAVQNLGSTEVDLWGQVVTDGGVECQVEFQYGPTAAYEFGETGWQGGYTSGETFTAHVIGLAVGNTTHFRARVQNTGGVVNGADTSFTSAFTAPTSFMAKAFDEETVLVTWTKVGDQTLVVIKKGSTPADRLDGETYFGPDDSCTFSSLESGVTYFLKAWSVLGNGTYSTGYSEDVCATPGVNPLEEFELVNPDAPTAPNWWFGVPLGTRMVHWPGYSTVEAGASGWGIPSSTAWLIYWAILLTAIVAAVGLMSGGSGLLMVGALGMGLFAMTVILGGVGWLLIVMGIVGIAALSIAK